MILKAKTDSEHIKVLFFIPNVMKRGGIESFLMSYFRNMDKSKITFIFCQLCSTNEKGVLDKEIIENGGLVEYMQFSNKHIFKSKKSIKILLKKHRPDIIHVHGDADCVGLLLILKFCKAKNVICHSHNTNSPSNRSKLLIWIKRHLSSTFCDFRFACSHEAGKWLFGKKQFSIIPNAICTKDFSFSNTKRIYLRKLYNIKDNTIVIGCVGHIMIRHKHQDFLVEIAKLALEKKINIIVCLVGGGTNLNELKNRCINEKIFNVIFTGEISNVSGYYSMFDVLALPSFYEGLGITCIEGICSGLFAIISDKVPMLNGKCDRELQIPATIDLIDVWLKELCERAKTRFLDGEQYIAKIGFSIEKESQRLFEHYQKISSKTS